MAAPILPQSQRAITEEQSEQEFKTTWLNGFKGIRDYHREVTGDNSLHQKELENLSRCLVILQKLREGRSDEWALHSLHDYANEQAVMLAPRLDALREEGKLQAEAVRENRERNSLQALLPGRDLSPIFEDLERDFRRLADVMGPVQAVRRRGRWERLSYSILEAGIVFMIFTLGFGLVGDSACQLASAAARVARPNLPEFKPETCSGIWFAVTAFLFLLERYFLGEKIERLIAARVRRSTTNEICSYFARWTQLEYNIAFREFVVQDLKREREKAASVAST